MTDTFERSIPQVTPEQAVSEREAMLRNILDPPIIDDTGRSFGYGNYEYAKDSGLLDMFAYDPEHDIDGLIHVLVGDVKEQAHGSAEVGGFHINPNPLYAQGEFNSFEDTDHLKGANSYLRKRYIQRPFEPYRAQVTVRGHRKYKAGKDTEGKPVTETVDNGMFPKEYDALTALQAIRIARDSRDPAEDREFDDKRIAKGSAPMIDGTAQMPILMVLDKADKIVTAYPIPKESGYMKLGEAAIDQALGLL